MSFDAALQQLLCDRRLTPEDVAGILMLERDLSRPWWHRLIHWIATLTLLTCFACSHPAPQPVHAQPPFAGDVRTLACLDLRDHIVSMYVDEYLAGVQAAPSPLERIMFEVAWREQLAKRGSFDRFEESCESSLTERQYTCGIASASQEALSACMKLSGVSR